MDKELLNAFSQLLSEQLAPINERISSLENKIATEISNSESRMLAVIENNISDSESRMLAVIENKVDNAFGALADGHKGLSDKMSRIDEMADAIDEMKGSFVALEALLATNKVIPFDIKKAQG